MNNEASGATLHTYITFRVWLAALWQTTAEKEFFKQYNLSLCLVIVSQQLEGNVNVVYKQSTVRTVF